MAFQFVNYYGSVFYLAFLKGRFAPSVQHQSKLADMCPPSGCMAEVCVHLLFIAVLVPVFQNFVELGLPYLRNLIRKQSIVVADSEENQFVRWEKDFILNPIVAPHLFDDYQELAVQYGFLTMFAAAFPLASLFALINNIFEIRVDGSKYITQFQRPVPARDRDIGPWMSILTVFTNLAVITNGLLICFTSDSIDSLVYEHWYKDKFLSFPDFVFSNFSCSNYLPK